MSDATPTMPSDHDSAGPFDALPPAERRRRVWSWALWDWATQPFNTVVLTFVFTALYLTTDSFVDPAVVALQSLGGVVFWVAGLALTCFVGPAQTASRSFLARLSPAGQESEIFGLYATTGRAVSFLTPALWGLVIALTGATIWGVLAIVAVILAGLVLMLVVTDPVEH